MVAKHNFRALVATTRATTTTSLDELIAISGWPVVLGATPRRLERELSLGLPECLLFWLDDLEAMGATARLIAW